MQLVFKHKILSLSTPAVMGILNVTPDSFYDGGKFTDERSILAHTEKMISEGADIIDIGACSTRPNAPIITQEEELKRLIPTIKLLRKRYDAVILSADTFRSNVAMRAIQEGADMINDVSGGSVIASPDALIGAKQSPRMFEIIGESKVPYVLMHIQGMPQTMQKNPEYKNVVGEVMDFFKERIYALKKAGASQIIIDPGFGFGKTLEHNYSLLKNLSIFKELELPILAGISRKSMINKALGTTPETALNGTTAANMIALMNGANILRVHDVKETKEAVKIFNFTNI